MHEQHDSLLITGENRFEATDEPQTALRGVRHLATRLAVIGAAVGAVLLCIASWQDDMLPVWNLGLTVGGLSGMAVLAATEAKIAELYVHEVHACERHVRRDIAAFRQDLRESRQSLSQEIRELREKLEAIELAQRAISSEVGAIVSRDNELARRRNGSR